MISRKLLNRKKGYENYYEQHHIVPVSIDGNNDYKNKVLLTAKEHFVAHLLLTKCFSGVMREKMWHALNCMIRKSANQKRYKISAKTFEEIRREVALITSLKTKGVPKSEEHKLKQRGKKRKPEDIARCVATRIARGHHRVSEETKNKIREKRKLQIIDGKKISEAQIRKGSNKWTEERRKSFKHPGRKKVLQFTKDGMLVNEHDSVSAAAQSLNVTIMCISDCLNGRQKTSKGFVFKLKSAA